MFNSIRELINNNKIVVKNFSYLSALKFFTILLPLATYPYLIKTLGLDIYGSVVFAQVLAGYFTVLIDFGFNITATKEVAVHRDSRIKLGEIVSAVSQIKVVLFIVSFILLLILCYSIPYLSDNRALFLLSFLICLNELLFPQWFFQGIEEMKYITIINLVSRVIFVGLIFLFVKNSNDFLMVPILNGIGVIIGGLVSLLIILKKYKIKFILQSITACMSHLRYTLPIFASNAIISVKDRFSTLFIGTFLGMENVAIYDLGIKVMNIIIQPIDIANAVIYPRIAITKNMNFLKLFIRNSVILISIVILIIQFMLPYLIGLIMETPDKAVFIIRYLLIVPIIMSISMPLARNCLIVNGKNRIFAKSMFYTTITYLVCIGFSYVFNLTEYLFTYVVIALITYVFELAYRVYACRYYKLI